MRLRRIASCDIPIIYFTSGGIWVWPISIWIILLQHDRQKAICINNSFDACQMDTVITIRARSRKVADFRTRSCSKINEMSALGARTRRAIWFGPNFSKLGRYSLSVWETYVRWAVPEIVYYWAKPADAVRCRVSRDRWFTRECMLGGQNANGISCSSVFGRGRTRDGAIFSVGQDGK